MEEKGINPQGLALVLAALAYLTARPGMCFLQPHHAVAACNPEPQMHERDISIPVPHS